MSTCDNCGEKVDLPDNSEFYFCSPECRSEYDLPHEQ